MLFSQNKKKRRNAFGLLKGKPEGRREALGVNGRKSLERILKKWVSI